MNFFFTVTTGALIPSPPPSVWAIATKRSIDYAPQQERSLWHRPSSSAC